MEQVYIIIKYVNKKNVSSVTEYIELYKTPLKK